MHKLKAGVLALVLLSAVVPALARNVVLVSHNLRSTTGALSTLAWKTCAAAPYSVPCLNPGNAWVQANGITGSDVTWDWDPVTGVLTGTGRYEAATFINSNPAGSSILADRVVNLVIDVGAGTTTASSYECIEGSFVATVGSNACGTFSLGEDYLLDTVMAYNVGGNATCVNRIFGGDDYSTGTPRGLTTQGASGGCDATLGAFALWTIAQDDNLDGGTLILTNGQCLTCANVSYMTFRYEGPPAPVGGVANPDSATAIGTTPVDVNIVANDTGFADPVTVTITSPPANGTATITGSPGARNAIFATYTAAADYEGPDAFTYSVSDGVSTATATVTIAVASGAMSSRFAGDWQTFQANAAHTGYVPGTLNTAMFVQRWQASVPNVGGLNPVAVGAGKVFVSTPSYFGTSGLYAYSLATGNLAWEAPYSSLYSTNPPAYANGRVYLQTGKGTSGTSQPLLRAYDATSGALAFQSAFGAQWESYKAPTIVDDTVYINGGYYGGMYAFDATDGSERWFNSSLAQRDGWTPAVDGTYAYTYLNGVLTAVNRSSGATAFSVSNSSTFDSAVPALGGANNAIVISGGQLVSINLGSRSIAWQRAGSFTGQPAVAKGVIYAISAGALSVRDEATGNLLWSWAPSPGDTLAGEVLVTDSHVLVSSSSRTYAVSLATRQSDWSHLAGGSLALADYTLLIASRSTGTLTAIQVGPPGAFDDDAVAYRSTPVAVDVLGNDVGFAVPATATIESDPAHGTVEVTGSPGDAATVRVVYTPDDDYIGPDSFQYQVSDGILTGVATVNLDVRLPEALPDSAETRRDTAVDLDVLKNDLGFADPVSVEITSTPTVGSVEVINSPGTAAAIRVRYQPPAGFSGSASFEYRVTDARNTATAQATVTVLPYRANPDTYTVLSGSYTNLSVAANDVGFQDPVTVRVVSAPTVGSASSFSSSGNADQVSIYYSATSGSYVTSLTYEITDGTRTDRARVTLNVVPYIAQDDFATTSKGTAVSISVTANDLGFGYYRTVGIYVNPQHGTATAPSGPGYEPVITYTPAPGFLGTDTFQYAIDDGTKVGIATVTVQVINDTDGDRIDDGVDNCLGVYNPDQRDADGDGYGNQCDGDFNNDGRVNFADLAWFRSRFGTNDPVADLDGNGVVNFADLSRFTLLFGKPPGPSAQVP